MRSFYFGSLLIVCAGLMIVQAVAQSSQPSNGSPPSASQSNTPQSQKDTQTPSASELPPSEAPPRSEDDTSASTDDRNFSSSRETLIDISPPKNDLKEHPGSAAALSRATDEEDPSDVQEFHEWNPMKALKDIEVGDYYFKRKNYRAALDRYKEALIYKENDAVATFRLAVCQDQQGDRADALQNYAAYLKILPRGPFADQASEGIERLSAEATKTTARTKDEAKSSEPVKP